MCVWKSGSFYRNAASKDLTDVRVVFGDQLLLHFPELHLHLFLSHGGNRKCLYLLQKVLDQVFSRLKERENRILQ